jgi:hypothetical protein
MRSTSVSRFDQWEPALQNMEPGDCQQRGTPESRFHAAHFNTAELEASAKIVEKAVQARSLALRFFKQEAGQERKLGTEVERLEQCIGRQKQQACKIM